MGSGKGSDGLGEDGAVDTHLMAVMEVKVEVNWETRLGRGKDRSRTGLGKD